MSPPGGVNARWLRRVILLSALAGIVGVVVQILAVCQSQATPNWTRKYGADCNFCHYPFPPRLNHFGQRFRWAAYRTPAEFGKDQEPLDVGEFLAARITTSFNYENTKGQMERTEFQLDDATLFYTGAISRNFGGVFSPRYSSDGDVSIRGELQGILGGRKGWVGFRAGQILPIVLFGPGGLDRPTGASLPPVDVSLLTRGGFPFRMISTQKGIELSVAHEHGRLLGQVLNGVNQQASSFDLDPDKDFLVAYEHLFGEIASSFTIFYYYGTSHLDVMTAGPGIPITADDRVDFSRLAVNGNWLFRAGEIGFLEVLAGYVHSYDNLPANVRTDKEGNAYWVEAQEVLLGPELAFYQRASFFDQDAARDGSTRKIYTIGAAKRVQTWGRLAAEYTYTDNRDDEANGASGHGAVLELFLSW